MSDYLNELKLPNRILLGPGPSNVHPRVLQAMLSPMLGHLDPDFWPVLDQVRDMLRLVLGTTHNWTLPLSATGTAGMEAAFCNVVEPGDRVVIVVNGFFGGRMVEIAARCGADVQRIDVPWGKPVLPELVEQALSAQGQVKAVGVVHAETSTGVLSPLQEIAQVVHHHDALLIVDAVTSLGGVELCMDEWDLDICYGASQKCLGAPPGLAPISLGPRAVDVCDPAQTPGAELVPGSGDLRGLLVRAATVSPHRAHSHALCLARSVASPYGRGRAAALATARAHRGGTAGGAGSARARVVRRSGLSLGPVDHHCRAGHRSTPRRSNASSIRNTTSRLAAGWAPSRGRSGASV